MANIGQIVAALAGGSLITMCVMLVLRCRAYEQRAERRRRIDTAVSAVLTGVEAMRCGWAPDEDASEEDAGAAVEVYARAHLRLIAARPATKPGGRRDSQTTPARGSSAARPRRLGQRRR